MTVNRIDDRDTWDTFVDESPSGLLFHKWDYLNLTAKHTESTLIPCAISKGDELICVFPLFCKRMHGINAVFSPPPLTTIPHLGCVMSRNFEGLKQSKKESLLGMVAEEIQDEIRSFSPNFLSITFVPEFNDVRHYLWNRCDARVRYTYTINLERSLEELWNNLHTKLRNKLKKAAGAGLRLEKTTDVATFHRLISERFRDPSLDIPPIRRDYLEDLMRAYPERIGIYFLYDAEDEVTAVVAAQEYKRFLLWIGTPKVQTAHAANEYLQWLLIQRAKSEGYRVFENMGANNPDLVFFKSKFNPDLKMYFEIEEKDTLGSVSVWAYLTFVKRLMITAGRV
ncbi:MAG: GNAT family N-acetyltransferase [Methanoculleus sp.]|uniref:GNAT family N-acetyltransferase n=2 Tax=Methanoculleus sp. TaxID=90427 RepID=UPI0025ED481A|nr:GNAT family N-acetyltransferase [Methanoculleus sp.]MCK9316761.1 GNAT family N-acetyltransferase [Methanoculleus sp.]MDD2252778.1 GNAT family N-acetyltransferase [Methanoculleus sp.]MDD3215239.1 GNAT family N-acetyltransferase [Methanoculleus sp.]MDD4313021.1 GNAT family N-acetyltransferase [Methanoculleus sp.]MDD4469608.1 GNAT family N-acetyltransferase [Methanoculleus sp.]